MSKRTVKKINLALQGGGAHGAFAWGVVDRLLQDDRIVFDGVCATSAGAMNACALAYGMHLGSLNGRGREQARETLELFWRNIHEAGARYSPVKSGPWTALFGGIENTPGYQFFEFMNRTFSPYQTNPFDFNPLRDVLAKTIDFDELRKCSCLKLFISATNVRTGKVKVFEAQDMTIEAPLASACLPFLFKAVEIDGEAYWDGGYMGNPAMFPLWYKTETRDVLIAHINPIHRPNVPKTAPEIQNRVNEISFNASLLKELRAIHFVKKLKEHDLLRDGYDARFHELLVHSVRAEKAMCQFSVASKFDTSWPFLQELKARGSRAMDDWLEANFDAIGVRDTFDFDAEFATSIGEMFEGSTMFAAAE